jgi:hypothetical protein
MKPLVAVRQKTSLEVAEAHDLLAQLLSRQERLELEHPPSSDGRALRARSTFPTARLTRIPTGRLGVSLDLARSSGFTEIHLLIEYSRDYVRWRNRVAGTGAVLMVVFLLPVLLSALNHSIAGLALFGFWEALGFLLMGVVMIRGDLLLDARAKRLEGDLWRALRLRGLLMIAEKEKAASEWASALTSMLVLAMALPFLWAMTLFGYGHVAFPALLFLFFPFFLAYIAFFTTDWLPFRYQWRVRRILLAVSWFGFTFLSPFFALGTFHEMPKSAPAGMAAGAFHDLFAFFGFPFVLAAHIMPLQSLLKYLRSTQGRYGDVLAAPSGGLEDPFPKVVPLTVFRAASFATLALLTVGFIYCSYKLTTEYWNFLIILGAPESALGRLGDSIPESVRQQTPAVILGFLAWPWALLVGTWLFLKLRGLWVRLYPPRVGEPVALDLLTHPGFQESVRVCLGAKSLVAVWARAPGNRVYGAALQRHGWNRRHHRLYLDRSTFLHLRRSQQREAIIWHEVGHVLRARNRESILFDLLFLVWAEHARTTITDSIQTELACDRFVYEAMRTVEPLREVLIFLDSSTTPVINDRGTGLLAPIARLVALAVGVERLSDWHPHVSTRLAVLESLQAEASPQ